MEYLREPNMELTENIDMEKIQTAAKTKDIICAKPLVYEKGVGLHFNLSGYKAIMPVKETAYTPDGSDIKEAAIITRVNKNVCFTVKDIKSTDTGTVIYLSRKEIQRIAYKEYISKLRPGDVIPCCVTHVDSFGVFCDIGCGITALMPIDFMSVSRINSPSDRFYAGQNIYACVKSVDDAGRIVLTHKELLGTWLENARLFKPQSVTTGIVRSIEDYGVFIELMPNLAGLAESCDGIKNGDVVNVYIKSILPDKMKVKLVIISKAETSMPSKNIKYFISDGHIDFWRYSTDSGIKNIYTDFT